MKNIVFVETANDGTIGGSHTCLLNILRKIDLNKYRPHIFIYDKTNFERSLSELNVKYSILEQNPSTSPCLLYRKVQNYYNLCFRKRQTYVDLLKTIDTHILVLNNSIYGMDVLISTAKILGIPIIAYERGFFRYRSIDLKASKTLYASIPVSLSVKDHMVRQGYAGKMEVIYDGLDNLADDNSISKTKCRVKFGIEPADATVIGIVGNIREWKGQEYFIKAINILSQRYKNLIAIIAGGHSTKDAAYYEKLRLMVDGAGNGKKIIFTGFINNVNELLSSIDILVHASIRPEPFGMVLLEAMLNKVPIVATNCGGPVEILQEGRCGLLVPPYNEQAIVSCIETYINNKHFREDKVQKAYERVTSNFTLNSTISKFEKIIEEASLSQTAKLDVCRTML